MGRHDTIVETLPRVYLRMLNEKLAPAEIAAAGISPIRVIQDNDSPSGGTLVEASRAVADMAAAVTVYDARLDGASAISLVSVSTTIETIGSTTVEMGLDTRCEGTLALSSCNVTSSASNTPACDVALH